MREARGIERGARGPEAALALSPRMADAYQTMLTTLSPRQRDVLQGILAGKLNKAMAFELGISVRTVEGYRAGLMARTHARNASELVLMSASTDSAHANATSGLERHALILKGKGPRPKGSSAQTRTT